MMESKVKVVMFALSPVICLSLFRHVNGSGLARIFVDPDWIVD